MRTRHIFSTLTAVFACLTAAFTICITLLAMNAEPQMLRTPDGAVSQARAMLDALCSGDPSAVSPYLYGTPNLSSVSEGEDPALDLLWDSYRHSLHYTILGDFRPADSGVCVDVSIQSLDLSPVLSELGSQIQQLLEKKSASKSSAELYGDDGRLLPELADRILYDAVLLSVDKAGTTRQQTVTLSLVCEDGHWWVMPERGLLDVLSGALPA